MTVQGISPLQAISQLCESCETPVSSEFTMFGNQCITLVVVAQADALGTKIGDQWTGWTGWTDFFLWAGCVNQFS